MPSHTARRTAFSTARFEAGPSPACQPRTPVRAHSRIPARILRGQAADLVQLLEIFGTELQLDRGQIIFELAGLLGTDNDACDSGLAEQPGQGDLRHSRVTALGDSLKDVHNGVALLQSHRRKTEFAAYAPDRTRRSRGNLPVREAARERTPHQQPDFLQIEQRGNDFAVQRSAQQVSELSCLQSSRTSPDAPARKSRGPSPVARPRNSSSRYIGPCHGGPDR